MDAIKAYEKSINKAESHESYCKLGELYRITKHYTKSKESYEKAISFPDADPETFREYAFSLLSVNQLEEAKKNFQIYADKTNDDPKVEVYLHGCDQLINWKKDTLDWKINSIQGINTKDSEFAPHPYLNGLIFSSTGETDLVDYTEYEALHNNYYNIYYAHTTNSNINFSEKKIFSNKLTSFYHDGPVAITHDSSAIYFCQLERNGKSERMHLFYSEIVNGKIEDPKPFDYNNDEYSIMHPTFSSDGKILFFATDKDDSTGKFDIYFCKNTRKYGWSAPRPVPGLINTSGNELFPHYSEGKLFFASDGHFGYGGLDMFVALDKEQYKVISNLKAPLNSSHDDFSLYALNGKNGYFASNREGGKGLDDIYYYTQLEKIKEDEHPTMTGVFEYKNIKQAGTELILYDELGNEIARTITDDQGNFEFRNLSVDKNFKIMAVGDLDETDIYITNANGEKLILMNNSNGSFEFKPLDYNKSNILLPIEEEYPTLLTIKMKGFVYKKLKGDLSQRLEVFAYDEDGHLLARTYTNLDGSFEFKTLIPTSNYTIKIGTEDEVFLMILNSKGEMLADPEREGSSKFLFRRLSEDADVFNVLNEENVRIQILQKESFNLPSIYYETNSYEINANSAEQLDKLYILLKKNYHINVTFESYTDSKGKDTYNLKLSENRSKSAVKYLVKKGISKDRLIAVGFGESKLVNHCKDGVTCSDEEHAANRRTEISLIGKKFKF
jgi:outer membrane protein OmpA-like peptidoglycan-associated protein